MTPRQHSSAGQTVLLGISKHGDRDLRTLLIHGARSRGGPQVAAVALGHLRWLTRAAATIGRLHDCNPLPLHPMFLLHAGGFHT